MAAVALTTLKIVVGLLTGSLGILAEAAHSTLDLVAALVTLLAVRFSARARRHSSLRPWQNREPLGPVRNAPAAGHVRLDRVRSRAPPAASPDRSGGNLLVVCRDAHFDVN